MKKLWAPWRVNYIQAKKKSKCIFCENVKKGVKNSYVVFKTKYSSCMLNAFPYNNGHLMVFPLRHTNQLQRLNKEEVRDLFDALISSQKVLDKVLNPQGYNIGMNIGDIAGAGFAGHMHIHIVPRWKGDVNFMPVVADTKVISQSLGELHTQLINAYSKINQRIRR